MHNGDVGSSYYHQPYLHNPNPSSTPPDHPYASAPPEPSSTYSASDYSTTFPPYSHQQQPYTFPHLDAHQPNYYYPPYDQNQTPMSYDYTTQNYGSSPHHAIEDYGSYGDSGIYKYNGRKDELYKESRSESNVGVMFDDYGRPINVQNQREKQGYESSRKIVKATPKMEEQQDVTAGVLKFRVKLLSEGIGQSDMDVLCQVRKYHFWCLHK